MTPSHSGGPHAAGMVSGVCEVRAGSPGIGDHDMSAARLLSGARGERSVGAQVALWARSRKLGSLSKRAMASGTGLASLCCSRPIWLRTVGNAARGGLRSALVGFSGASTKGE